MTKPERRRRWRRRWTNNIYSKRPVIEVFDDDPDLDELIAAAKYAYAVLAVQSDAQSHAVCTRLRKALR